MSNSFYDLVAASEAHGNRFIFFSDLLKKGEISITGLREVQKMAGETGRVFLAWSIGNVFMDLSDFGPNATRYECEIMIGFFDMYLADKSLFSEIMLNAYDVVDDMYLHIRNDSQLISRLNWIQSLMM
jgi:hypothetical protein